MRDLIFGAMPEEKKFLLELGSELMSLSRQCKKTERVAFLPGDAHKMGQELRRIGMRMLLE